MAKCLMFSAAFVALSALFGLRLTRMRRYFN